jgi:Na+(H+)/acetate symporter ActP
MNPIAALILGATITFSPFAAIIAFIVTYDEYQHHLDKKSAKKQAFQSAIFTFVVFIIVGLLSGYFFNTYVVNH